MSGPSAAFDRKAVGHLDDECDPRKHDERRRQRDRVGRGKPLAGCALLQSGRCIINKPAMPCGANITMAMNRRPK